MRVKPCWTTALFYACGAAFLLLLNILDPFVSSQIYITGWSPESAFELIANKTVWLKVSIDGTEQPGFLEI